MRVTRLALLAVLLTGTGPGAAEEPPSRRLLQGDDATKAAALQKRVDELRAVGKFAEAVGPAEELLALRRRVQGEGHWETTDAAWVVKTLRQAAALPADKQAILGEARELAAKGVGLNNRGQLAEAEPLFRKALALRQEVLGPNNPDVARSCNDLGANLQARGRFQEAETLLRRALAIKEEALGPKHPDTSLSRNNLAAVVRRQGRSLEAEALYRQALASCEELLGPKHSLTAVCSGNLAAVLQAQGRSREAETLFRKALAVEEVLRGPKHLDTAANYHGLAAALQSQERAKEAEAAYRKALAAREEVLGPRHLDTAASWQGLAAALRAQGRSTEAEAFFRRALAVREEVLGPSHLDTAASYHGLAGSLQAQGRYTEAEALLRKALAVREEALGPKDPDTVLSWNNLASILQTQGRAREAEGLYRKALAVSAEMGGPKHLFTLRGCNNLALNLDAQGRFKEAEELLRKTLPLCEEALGPKHLYTITCRNNLAYNLQHQDRFKEAEPLFRKALATSEEVLGRRHPQTAGCCDNLAVNLQAQGRSREAGDLYRRALAINEEVLGPQHPETAHSYNNLGSALFVQGQAKEAETLFRKALPHVEKVLGVNHPTTATCCENLAGSLQAQGRPKEAESFWEQGARRAEASRLRLATSSLDRATVVRFYPHLGLATCRARLGRPVEAWSAAEAGLARGLLDDLAARAGLPPDPEADRADRERAGRLEVLDRLLPPLLTPEKLDEADRRRRDDLLAERTALDEQGARAAAERSRRAVLPLAEIQARLAPDAALVFWVDIDRTGDHWGCVLRRSGPPAWVSLRGSGAEGAWTEDDRKLWAQFRDDLEGGEAGLDRRARRLAALRLEPLAPCLAASADLPAVRHLIVVPVGPIAGIPIEVLTDRYLVSYAPSGTVLARLHDRHRPLAEPTLLALGDPNFKQPDGDPPPEPPAEGLYLALVLPGGNAAKAGLRSGDVLLRYGDAKLASQADLQLKEEGEAISVSVWRNGKTLDNLRLAPGKLGVVLSDDTPAVAIRKRRERDLLADARSRDGLQPLPGTRLEVGAIAGLLPEGKSTVLLGSKASEQELDALTAAGKLKGYRLLHLATHGTIDPTSAAHSWLALARDRLPDPEQQARLAAAGKKVPTGRLFVGDMAKWDLDADLVTLSACQTGLGPPGGGEGLLGFSQVLLGRGARSVLLSLWKVDDTATALLTSRFYQNLLGKRQGLDKALPKAEALQEAKRWLRALPRAEAEALAGKLARGTVRLGEEDKTPVPMAVVPAAPHGEMPFAHPRYWAAFILIGDPD